MEHNAQFFFQRALDKIRVGSVGVLADLNQAIELEPKNPQYHLERGLLKFKLDEYSSAFDDFSTAIEYSNDTVDLSKAHIMRAYCYACSLNTGSSSEFIQDLNWLIEHQFREPEIYRLRGSHMEDLREFEVAIEDYTEAYQLSEDVDDLQKRGQNYYYLKRYKEAIQDFAKIIASCKAGISYNQARTYDWRGSAYYMLGQEKQANDDFKEAMSLYSSLPYTSTQNIRQLSQEPFNMLKYMVIQKLPYEMPHKSNKYRQKIKKRL